MLVNKKTARMHESSIIHVQSPLVYRKSCPNKTSRIGKINAENYWQQMVYWYLLLETNLHMKCIFILHNWRGLSVHVEILVNYMIRMCVAYHKKINNTESVFTFSRYTKYCKMVYPPATKYFPCTYIQLFLNTLFLSY